MDEKNDIKQERLNIQLASHLLDWIDEQRKPSGITRSAFIAVLIAEAKKQRQPDTVKG